MKGLREEYIVSILEYLMLQNGNDANYWVSVGVPLASGFLGIVGVLIGLQISNHFQELQREREAAAMLAHKFTNILNYIVGTKVHIETVFDQHDYILEWFPYLEEFVGNRDIVDSIGHEELWLLIKCGHAQRFTEIVELENACHIIYMSLKKYNEMREEVARILAPFTEMKVEKGRAVASSAFTNKDAPYVPRLRHLCNNMADAAYDMLLVNKDKAEELSELLSSLYKAKNSRWKMPISIQIMKPD